MKAKCFITFIVLTSMLGWVAVTVSAANGAGDGKSRGSGGSGGVALQSPTEMSIHHAQLGDPAKSAIQRVVDLRPLKGIAYKPSPNDYDGTGTGFYFDSDFANDDFKQLWGPDNGGRDDIGNLHSAGVNFLHIYDWNQPGSGRNHTNFLNYCHSKNIAVAVPISAWYVVQVQSGQSQQAWFDNFVGEVYPNKSRHPAVVMWTLGNEFDKGGLGQTAQGIAMTAQAIVDAEDRAQIPASERIAFTSPVSFGVRPNTNDVPGVLAVQALQSAFAANLSDVFANRFIASANSNNSGDFLKTWALTSFPKLVPNMNFCLFEMGMDINPDPQSLVRDENQQGVYYADQLAKMLPIAEGTGPFLGHAVFSTVNEAWKNETEATYGVWKILANAGLGTGTTTSGATYPIDSWTAKPSFTSMQQAYTVSATANPNTVVQVTNQNSASTAVEVWIKVQLPPAIYNWPRADCVFDVTELTVTGSDGPIAIQTPFPDREAGFFNLPFGETVTIASKKPVGLLNGVVISFEREHGCPCGIGTDPTIFNQICSGDRNGTPGLPILNGVTAAELTLNTGSPLDTTKIFQETADISCVNGANATIRMNYDPGKGNKWNNGSWVGSNQNVIQIQNSWVDIANQNDDNSTRSGVYPYSCDQCIDTNSGPCGNGLHFGPFPTEAHCQVMRDPINGEFGGTVTITYLGPLSPTTTPPPPSTRVVTWTNDFDTDSTDLSLMLLAMSVYPPASETGSEDLNKDGVLDNTDLGLVFLHFGY